MTMQIEDETIILLLIASSVTLALIFLAFAYLIYLFKNKKSQAFLEENMRMLEWRKKMAHEHERCVQELAIEIHNKILQQAILIQTVARQEQKGAADMELQQLLAELTDSASLLTRSMNLEYLKSQSLSGLIESEIMVLQSESDLAYTINCPVEPDLAEETKIILFRIAKEAIENVSKHAMASFVAIDLLQSEDKFVLTIEDDGMGVSPEKIYGPPTHGFENMRHRAIAVNAKLDIRSTYMSGTKITLEMPV